MASFNACFSGLDKRDPSFRVLTAIFYDRRSLNFGYAAVFSVIALRMFIIRELESPCLPMHLYSSDLLGPDLFAYGSFTTKERDRLGKGLVEKATFPHQTGSFFAREAHVS